MGTAYFWVTGSTDTLLIRYDISVLTPQVKGELEIPTGGRRQSVRSTTARPVEDYSRFGVRPRWSVGRPWQVPT